MRTLGFLLIWIYFLFSQESSFRFGGELTMALGGDNLGTVLFLDGSKQNMNAGSGFTFSLGFEAKMSELPIGFKTMIGCKLLASKAIDVTILKSSFPIDILLFSYYEKHKAGLGFTYHLNPEMDWDRLAPRMNFDNALGILTEYSYSLDEVQFGLFYMAISYNLPEYPTDNGRIVYNTKFKANNIGIKMTLLLY